MYVPHDLVRPDGAGLPPRGLDTARPHPGCGVETARGSGASADAWARLIVGHTSGVVSRRSEIRVLFANDVALAADKKPKPA